MLTIFNLKSPYSPKEALTFLFVLFTFLFDKQYCFNDEIISLMYHRQGNKPGIYVHFYCQVLYLIQYKSGLELTLIVSQSVDCPGALYYLVF